MPSNHPEEWSINVMIFVLSNYMTGSGILVHAMKAVHRGIRDNSSKVPVIYYHIILEL